MTASTQPWILAGYSLFAIDGPVGLKIEVLARKVGKNKSSFYHHFADLEVFTGILLDYHRKRASIIAERERQCQNVIPELLEVLVDVKEDLFFNRQLRIHRDMPGFTECFEASSCEVVEAILDIWAEALGLPDRSALALIVLNLSLENFYLQITPETFSYDWLLNYMKGLQGMVGEYLKQERLSDLKQDH